MRFKKKLKMLRVGADLTQEELAIKCGLCSTTLTHYETGRREPNLANIVKIKQGLGCSFDELLDNDCTQ
jgi:transcriptional regulator with XRE-family HTH domain